MALLHGKRLVIFGCGYIGSALARAAVEAGAQVEALTRNPDKAAGLFSLGAAKVVLAELSSADWHGQISGGADLVVNCVSAGGTGPEGYRRSYVDGMRSILAWAAAGGAPVGTLVYTSSTSVYPQGDGAVVTEEMPAEGATPNGRLIRESEVLLEQAPVAAMDRAFILRLAGIYGPGRHHLLDQLRAVAPSLGGSGGYRLNLAHRDDVVSAILACLTARTSVGSGIFNVADLAPASRGEVVAWLAGQLGCPVPGFDGTAGVRRGGVPMPDRTISSAKLQRTLGWSPKYPDYRAGFMNLLSP
jgi:nucleoside-diphosphate-sugar epimerase